MTLIIRREKMVDEIWTYACTLLGLPDRGPIDDKILHVILSESSQALEFVCLLEDEYEIEFEDEEIDFNFFSSFTRIADIILKHKY